MLDSHIHIGQFYDDYYNADEVFDIVFGSEIIDKIIFSSTSSCIASVDYRQIYKEIKKALYKYPANMSAPLFWAVPDYIKQGLKIENVFNELDYCGFKLHPLGNSWDFENDTKQTDFLHEIFDCANRRKKQILIHAGESQVDRPNRFEQFFKEYKNAKIILAHCRPIAETLQLMAKYPNVFGDTAFVSNKSIQKIKASGFCERLIFGSDFPITYRYRKNNSIGMKEQYANDLKRIRIYKFLQ